MFLKHSTGKVVLVADVEDASVGVCIVQLAFRGPAVVLAAERMRLPIEERSSDQSVVAIVQTLEQCVDTVLKKYAGTDAKLSPKPPHDVYAIVRAPWSRYRTASASEKYQEARTATKEMIASLAKKALVQPSELERTSILETGVMQVFLNGYLTRNPIRKKATIISAVAFETDINAKLKEGIIGVFGTFLPGRTPLIFSGTSALLTVLNERMPDIHRYVILDVGGSVTSCSVVLKESVSQSTIVPEGLTSVLKRVSAGGLPEETMTQLRMLSSDTCSTDTCRALKDALARAEPDLTKVFGEAFAKLASKRRLPNAAILSAPVELSPWLQGFFTRIDFSQFTATMQPFTVEPMTAEHLHDVVTWQSNTLPDTGLSIAAGYVNILEETR